MAKIRVYLCDDVAALRLVLRTVLELEGCEIVGECGDGASAVEDVVELEPDVLLLDLSLPELDGLEVLEALRERAPEVKVVVFSGYPTAQLAEAALARGAKRYLEKGVDLEAVANAVREVGEAA